MIKVKRVLAPIDGTPFEEVNSFLTDNYVGVYGEYYDGSEGFVIFPLDNDEFTMYFAGIPKTLEELDEKVFELVEERINSVSTSRHLKPTILED